MIIFNQPITYDNKDYAIKGVRVKYYATSNEDGKSVVLYGYYTSDTSYTIASAHIKGNISLYDTFKTSGNTTLTYNSKSYTVTNSEIMYLVLTSNWCLKMYTIFTKFNEQNGRTLHFDKFFLFSWKIKEKLKKLKNAFFKKMNFCIFYKISKNSKTLEK